MHRPGPVEERQATRARRRPFLVAAAGRLNRSGLGRPGRPRRQARRWWILGVVGLAQLMVVLDATIVNIALPSAQRDLGFSNADRQWVVTAYSLAFGGLLLLGGRLSDLVGRRRMLIIGLVGFAAASALGGAANSFGVLVIGRGAAGGVRRDAGPGRAVHADRDVHRPGRARQGVRRLRRDRRGGRGGGAAAGRGADRVPVLAVVPVRQRRPGRDRGRGRGAAAGRTSS